MPDATSSLDLIFSRRSVRRYSPRSVPEELVQRMLEAAMVAPSACDEQPWHFVVVERRALLDSLAVRHPYGSSLKGAPLCIVPCVDLDLAITRYEGDFWIQDMSASTQNLLLAATALGLGAVWIGTYPAMDRVEAVREVLSLPANIVPLCLVPVGYPDEQPQPRSRFLKDRIHRDVW
jgi:nitroreductase